MLPCNDWQLVKVLYAYPMDLQSPEEPWGLHYTKPLPSLSQGAYHSYWVILDFLKPFVN